MKHYVLNYGPVLTDSMISQIRESLPAFAELEVADLRLQLDPSRPLRDQVIASIRKGIEFLNIRHAAGEPAWDNFMVVPPVLPVAAYWIGAAFVRVDLDIYSCQVDPDSEDEHQLVRVTPAVWFGVDNNGDVRASVE